MDDSAVIDLCDSPRQSQKDAAAGDQGGTLLSRVLARHAAALGPAERGYLARLPQDVLVLLDTGLASPRDVLLAAARDAAFPRAYSSGRAAEEAGDGWELTAVVEPAEPAWLARARVALTGLVSDATLAPRSTREAALSALNDIITSALARREDAAGRAVYLDKLARRIAKKAPADKSPGSPAKLSRLSAAQASPHETAGAAGDDAAVSRVVEALCRVLTSAGWFHDTVGEETGDGGQPRARIMLLADARELPALLARLRDVASLLETLRAEAKQAEAAKRAAAPLMAAMDALVIESDDDEDAAAAAWAEKSAADAAKMLATQSDEVDAAAAPGFDDGFDDELWERYARSGAGHAASQPPPAESPPSGEPASREPPASQRLDAGTTMPAGKTAAPTASMVSDDDDDDSIEIVAVVEASRPARRAVPAPPPPPPREECRITLYLPDGRGRARLLLPPTATMLDAYAAAKDYLAAPARPDAIAAAPPVLPPHNWATAPVVDTQAHRLIRPDPPPARTFAPHELATTTLAAAGLFPSGRLVLERAGAVPREVRAVGGRVDVLRLTTPLPNGDALVSPIVHLHDPHGDKGYALFRKMEALLPNGWGVSSHSQLLLGTFAGFPGSGHPLPVLLNNAFWQGKGGALGARASIPAQDYAEFAMRRAADAVRAHVVGGARPRAANAAADDLLRKRPLMQASGLLYPSNGTLFDHVDGMGHYLCLFSMGCAVDFTAGDRVVRFESGDAIIFNGGRAHQVMHGVRTVYPGTCPGCLPKLRNARLSLQLRQY